MKFKVDENLPVEAADLLRAAGYETDTVQEEGLNGAEDGALSERVRSEGRAILTLDLDFSDIRAHPPQDYLGIIVLRPSRQDKKLTPGSRPAAPAAARHGAARRKYLDCGAGPSPHPPGPCEAMRQLNRKSAPQVSGGRVQKKNNWADTPSYYDTPPPALVIDRQRPGKGYRHLLLRRDIETFIALLPDWTELSRGLSAIVLAPGEGSLDGYYGRRVVHVCAWEQDLWISYSTSHYGDHKALFDRLGVASHVVENGIMCEFTESQARAYQLLHILLHELGHHHDRLMTKLGGRPNRGEPYAEAYALRHEALIWDRYQTAFGPL